MLLERFYDQKLAQASYLVGCQTTGAALVVDPNRDAEQYLRLAEAKGMRVTHVTETHIHADYVSGSRELAQRAGATLYLSAQGGREWRYTYASGDHAVLLADGDAIDVGSVRVEARHTPGHTPEHLSFLVTDTHAADGPMGILTGDFVFVGDVGRPDLLERAVGVAGTMDAAARTLFRALQDFKQLPEYLQVWPGHGAGSACGKSLGAVPQTTVGYERRFNWALSVGDEDEFVRLVLAGQPEPPAYFAQMKRVNREGPPVLGAFRRPVRVAPARLREVVASGAFVVDVRRTADHAAGRVPGTINIPFNSSFTTRAASLAPYDRDIYLLAGDVDDAATSTAAAAARDLSMIGLDRVAGYFDGAALAAASEREPLETIPQMTAAELAQRRSGDGSRSPLVVDVRDRAEWEAGHIAGAKHVPLAHLAERLGELERDRPLVVHCQSGGRSSVAASLLRARGFRDVTNLSDGFAGWHQRGLPVERLAQAGERAQRTPA